MSRLVNWAAQAWERASRRLWKFQQWGNAVANANKYTYGNTGRHFNADPARNQHAHIDPQYM